MSGFQTSLLINLLMASAYPVPNLQSGCKYFYATVKMAKPPGFSALIISLKQFAGN